LGDVEVFHVRWSHFFFLAGVFLLQLCMSQENCQSSFAVGVDDDAILAFGELNSGSD
jgi:hypothetical protein